jgi:hypothetical protein|tara:strand:- start:38 stop:442 length:405 start_codon:yes stop_codon:yes gene_type:complete
MARYSNTRVNSRTVRFYDRASATRLTVQNIAEAMTAEQKTFTTLNNAFTSNNTTVSVSDPVVTFQDISFATVPDGFPAIQKDDFTVFVNGIAAEIDAIDSIAEVGSNVVITFNNSLNFDLEADDEFMITGKLVN